MSSSAVLSNVKMLQDVIFIEIDGVESAWDTYCFALDIESPGPKVHPAASGSAISEERMSVKEEVIGVKIEDQDVGLSEPSTQCAASPCHLLTRRADNPRDPKDTSEVQATLERIRNGPQC
ncbi:uncharacterized protein F5147DRAFT_779729 [Suillus discolor]|uniref:Uncharacterized protein n=1 Tax=Suillus discolor TaxID=1912936 RepID=A0A9P7EV55_9AGAM|nr:uncharacterized protein F5147DRAFT_779729 [Suillus discolor]KAG2092109.1 hypothetical protein F5147DRAFT_779729 [Suillus discolor]